MFLTLVMLIRGRSTVLLGSFGCDASEAPLDAPSYDPFELVWVHAQCVSVAALLDGLEGHVSRLAVIIGCATEHLGLDSGLHETF